MRRRDEERDAAQKDDALLPPSVETANLESLRQQLPALDEKIAQMRMELRHSPRLAKRIERTTLPINHKLAEFLQRSNYPTPECLLTEEVIDCVTQAYLPDERFDHLINCESCISVLVASFPGAGVQEGRLAPNLDDLLLQAIERFETTENRKIPVFKRILGWFSG